MKNREYICDCCGKKEDGERYRNAVYIPKDWKNVTLEATWNNKPYLADDPSRNIKRICPNCDYEPDIKLKRK